jgi:hypothetical protein
MCSQGNPDSAFRSQDSQTLPLSLFSLHAAQQQCQWATQSVMEVVTWRQVYHPWERYSCLSSCMPWPRILWGLLSLRGFCSSFPITSHDIMFKQFLYVLNEGCSCQVFAAEHSWKKHYKKMTQHPYTIRCYIHSYYKITLFFIQKSGENKYVILCGWLLWILGVTWKNGLDLATAFTTGHFKSMQWNISYLQVPGCRGLLHKKYLYSILAELTLHKWPTFLPTPWHWKKKKTTLQMFA